MQLRNSIIDRLWIDAIAIPCFAAAQRLDPAKIEQELIFLARMGWARQEQGRWNLTPEGRKTLANLRVKQ